MFLFYCLFLLIKYSTYSYFVIFLFPILTLTGVYLTLFVFLFAVYLTFSTLFVNLASYFLVKFNLYVNLLVVMSLFFDFVFETVFYLLSLINFLMIFLSFSWVIYCSTIFYLILSYFLGYYFLLDEKTKELFCDFYFTFYF